MEKTCAILFKKKKRGAGAVSIDTLQQKIRKTKNPTMLTLAPFGGALPPVFAPEGRGTAEGWGAYAQALLKGVKGIVPALRLSFAGFALLGPEGLTQLGKILRTGEELGFYTLVDAPELLSPEAAEAAAGALRMPGSPDGLVISSYLGSDMLKPFLSACGEGEKDVFVLVRSANRSASELQDLRTGSRLVHEVAADYANRWGGDTVGKFGYARVGLMAAANAPESLRALRSKYPDRFLVLDGFDYSTANGKTCCPGFDRLGHGACVCVGRTIVDAWKEAPGENPIAQAQAAAERVKRNLARYVTVL